MTKQTDLCARFSWWVVHIWIYSQNFTIFTTTVTILQARRDYLLNYKHEEVQPEPPVN